MSKIYRLSEFSGADFAEQISTAMAVLKEDVGSTLIIEPGEYVLTSEMARQAQYNVMSGAWTSYPQDIMFCPEYKYYVGIDLTGHKGTKILGYGVKIIVDGFMEVVCMTDCEDVTVEGFTVDHKRKPFSVGKLTKRVTESEDSAYFDVELYDEYPVMPGTPINMRYFVYNTDTKRLEWPELYDPKGEVIDEHTLRYRGKYFTGDRSGYDFYVWHTYHSRPVILMQRSKNVTVRNVTVHSQPGMGITGNRTENILIDGFCDVPAPGLHMSTNSDAMHFTACTGTIKVVNSSFIGQGDDAINVHGYYHEVIEQDGCRYVVKNLFPDGISHTQTPDYPDVGDIMEINDKESLELLGTRRVVAVKQSEENGRICEIVLDSPLPEDAVEKKMFLFDATRLPAVEFVNNYCCGNFARGVLIKTRNVNIENNVFERTMGTAIDVYAESSWSEGTNPSDITIFNNVIVGCAYFNGPKGIGGIQVGVHADKHPSCPQVKNVTIMHNTINCPESAFAIEAESIDGLIIKKNENLSGKKTVKVFGCNNVTIKE